MTHDETLVLAGQVIDRLLEERLPAIKAGLRARVLAEIPAIPRDYDPEFDIRPDPAGRWRVILVNNLLRRAVTTWRADMLRLLRDHLTQVGRL